MGVNKLPDGRFMVHCRLRIDGKIVARQKIVSGTLTEARDKYAEMRTEVRSGQTGSLTSAANFGEVLSFYAEKRKGSRGFGKNRYIINRLHAALGAVPMVSLRERFDRFLTILRQDTSNRFARPVSQVTINRYIIYAKAACGLALTFEKIDRNPLTIFRPEPENGRDRILSQYERQRLLNVLEKESPHLVPAFTFASQIPVRKSELTGMRRQHLDLISQTIRLPNGKTKNGQGVFLPIPPTMTQYFASIPAASDYLFYRQDSAGACHPLGDFKKSWARALRLAGIEGYHWHDTRHEAASLLVDLGVPERDVREIANWKTPNMLEKYYHIAPKKSTESVRKVLKREYVCEYIKAVAV